MANQPAAERLLHVWTDLPSDHPMPLIERRRIVGEHMMISNVTLEPGFTLASHSHFNEQFMVMLEGRAIFGLGEPNTPSYREVEVTGGQVLVLPPNLPHSCRAIERCRILDLFSPPSTTTGVDQKR